jgi:hypothetical protein
MCTTSSRSTGRFVDPDPHQGAARLGSFDGGLRKQRDRVEDMMIRKANSSSGSARWELV